MQAIKTMIVALLLIPTYTHSSERHSLRNKKIVSHIPFPQKIDADFTSAVTASCIIVDAKVTAARNKRTQDMAELSFCYKVLHATKKTNSPLYEMNTTYIVSEIVQRTKNITSVLKQV